MAERLFGYELREHQAAILRYSGGRMAVSAVPGSGKTLVLALLAARLIVEGQIGDESEVLVVTVQNSAVNNISQRIREILTREGLPAVGYRVSTLHKLASDMVRQRSDLAGVEEGFAIIDETDTARLMHNAADVWIAEYRALWESYVPQEDGEISAFVERSWREETERIGREVTKLCKHHRRTPEEARAALAEALGGAELDPFLAMGIDLYALYSQYLRAPNGLDFDDLIWRAIDALEQDNTFLENLRQRWPFILEDEAQDSSPLQEQILARLAGAAGHWVRVGDPNQAINSTFTAADPRYFRQFLAREDVDCRPLPQSGRCAPKIMALANHLVHWACDEHPDPAVRELAFARQDILPTDLGDPQRNPSDGESQIYVRTEAFPDVDTQAVEVARWAADLIRRQPESTVAVLCPATWQGDKVVMALEEMASTAPHVLIDDLLRSTPRTRSVAGVLTTVLAYLGSPTSARDLSALYSELVQHHGGNASTDPRRRRRGTLIRSVAPQQLLFPRAIVDLRDVLPPGVEAEGPDIQALQRFAERVARWVRASALPVDQLLLTVAQDLYESEEELAICHTLATSLRATADMYPLWRLAQFADELREVARNRRRISGLSLTDAGYAAEPGRIAVTTMHKAKGLEWDTVYILCVDSLEFPSYRGDVFRDELVFMPDRAPAVEARHTLERLLEEDVWLPEASAVEQARLETIAERLRLLYVGITRARRHLALTHSARNGQRPVQPAAPLQVLAAALDMGLGAEDATKGEAGRTTWRD